MPLPTPNTDESEDDFMDRCMGNDTMVEEFPDSGQRLKVCQSQWDNDRSATMVADRIETRAFDPEQAELRVQRKDNGTRTIRGYAALFDVWSPDYDGFREIIRPGAFTDTLKSKKSDVRGLFNHNADRVLGRVRAGTMELRVDNKGLFYEIDAPDSAADVVEAIERRDITGSSFSFTTRKEGDAWHYDEKGRAERELLAVDVFDVGPVTFPFYPKTTAAARSLERWQNKRRAVEQQQQAAKAAQRAAWIEHCERTGSQWWDEVEDWWLVAKGG